MRGANPNLLTSPRQCGGIQGGFVVTLNGTSSSQDVITSSSDITHPPLKFPLAPLKIPVHRKIAHSSIPSLWTPFIPLARGISVSYIMENSIKYWSKSNIRIHLFVPPGPINSSMYHFTTLCIMKKYFTCGRTDA